MFHTLWDYELSHGLQKLHQTYLESGQNKNDDNLKTINSQKLKVQLQTELSIPGGKPEILRRSIVFPGGNVLSDQYGRSDLSFQN